MLERLFKEVKRRTRVVGVFPNETSAAALAAEIALRSSEQWALQRYLTMDALEAVGEPNPQHSRHRLERPCVKDLALVQGTTSEQSPRWRGLPKNFHLERARGMLPLFTELDPGSPSRSTLLLPKHAPLAKSPRCLDEPVECADTPCMYCFPLSGALVRSEEDGTLLVLLQIIIYFDTNVILFVLWHRSILTTKRARSPLLKDPNPLIHSTAERRSSRKLSK